MNFTLNIYNKGKVEKTYTSESYDLMFGTMEDFINVIDLRILDEGLSDVDSIKLLMGLVGGSMTQLKPLLLDVFEGLTEEELRRTKVSELIGVIINILKYSYCEIMGVASGKNV